MGLMILNIRTTIESNEFRKDSFKNFKNCTLREMFDFWLDAFEKIPDFFGFCKWTISSKNFFYVVLKTLSKRIEPLSIQFSNSARFKKIITRSLFLIKT